MRKAKKVFASFSQKFDAAMLGVREADKLNPLCGTSSNQRGVISITKIFPKVAVFVIIVTLVTLSSCGGGNPNEKKLTVKNVEFSGDVGEYLKVVDGVYKLEKNEQDIWIDVTFELIKEFPNPEEIEMFSDYGYIRDELRLTLLDKSGASIITLNTSGLQHHNGLTQELFAKGKAGRQTTITIDARGNFNATKAEQAIKESVNFKIEADFR